MDFFDRHLPELSLEGRVGGTFVNSTLQKYCRNIVYVISLCGGRPIVCDKSWKLRCNFDCGYSHVLLTSSPSLCPSHPWSPTLPTVTYLSFGQINSHRTIVLRSLCRECTIAIKSMRSKVGERMLNGVQM